MKILAGLAALGVAIGLGFWVLVATTAPTPVHAAPATNPNTAYLTVLAAKNVGVTSPQAAITMGHRVCAALTTEHVNRWMEGTRLVSVGYTGDEAATIVGASVASYCQDQSGTYGNQSGY
ncbi:DUF732 domain-containing protein [Nocardia jiangxiensis]|uniref:DUF732 domain-containing protein n=1 Tax=Nocardia jiangxiensis TaxID=282685 RepID=UPI0002FAE8DD|nr:DUF732 domain-containing protein [Nocardia jiangxiensis]